MYFLCRWIGQKKDGADSEQQKNGTQNDLTLKLEKKHLVYCIKEKSE